MLRSPSRLVSALAIALIGASVSGFESDPAPSTKSAARLEAESSNNDSPSEAKSSAKTAASKPGETKRVEKGLPRRWRIDDGELPAFTPEREAAAMTFAKRHHSELADLLAVLAKTNRPEYETAIRELFNTSELLARQEQKDPIRASHELEAWKIHSRIQLLAARWTMEPDDALRSELEAALQSQIDQRLAAMAAERKALKERLERIETLADQLKQNRERQVKRQLEVLTGGKAEAERNAKDAKESKASESKDAARSKESKDASKKNTKPAGK
ncbi:MAG TPA: hypothetical protein VGE52_16800 [Pirellulales bacterium]